MSFFLLLCFWLFLLLSPFQSLLSSSCAPAGGKQNDLKKDIYCARASDVGFKILKWPQGRITKTKDSLISPRRTTKTTTWINDDTAVAHFHLLSSIPPCSLSCSLRCLSFSIETSEAKLPGQCRVVLSLCNENNNNTLGRSFFSLSLSFSVVLLLWPTQHHDVLHHPVPHLYLLCSSSVGNCAWFFQALFLSAYSGFFFVWN